MGWNTVLHASPCYFAPTLVGVQQQTSPVWVIMRWSLFICKPRGPVTCAARSCCRGNAAVLRGDEAASQEGGGVCAAMQRQKAGFASCAASSRQTWSSQPCRLHSLLSRDVTIRLDRGLANKSTWEPTARGLLAVKRYDRCLQYCSKWRHPPDKTQRWAVWLNRAIYFPRGLGFRTDRGAACCDGWMSRTCSAAGAARGQHNSPGHHECFSATGAAVLPGKQNRPTVFQRRCYTTCSSNRFVVSKYVCVCHSQLQSALVAGSNYCSNRIKVIKSQVWIPTYYYWSTESFSPHKLLCFTWCWKYYLPQTHYLADKIISHHSQDLLHEN